jgi:hypothetical protein
VSENPHPGKGGWPNAFGIGFFSKLFYILRIKPDVYGLRQILAEFGTYRFEFPLKISEAIGVS